MNKISISGIKSGKFASIVEIKKSLRPIGSQQLIRIHQSLLNDQSANLRMILQNRNNFKLNLKDYDRICASLPDYVKADNAYIESNLTPDNRILDETTKIEAENRRMKTCKILNKLISVFCTTISETYHVINPSALRFTLKKTDLPLQSNEGQPISSAFLSMFDTFQRMLENKDPSLHLAENNSWLELLPSLSRDQRKTELIKVACSADHSDVLIDISYLSMNSDFLGIIAKSTNWKVRVAAADSPYLFFESREILKNDDNGLVKQIASKY